MGGGLIQLVSYGSQDLHLTNNPSMTFFKAVYRKHTNFSIESIGELLLGNTNFGGNCISEISRKGDLLYKMYLQVILPPATTVITSNVPTYENWTNSVGYALLEEVSIVIGGQEIDTHYSEWFDIWNELSDPHKKEWNMVGKKATYSSLIQKQTDNTRYYIPLQFWFNKNPGLALPLIAISHHKVEIKIKLRSLDSLIVTDGSGVSTSGNIQEIQLFIDYIYLDADERRRFAQTEHEYLFEQIQYNVGTVANGQNSKYLIFNHPVKEIIWALRNTSRGSESSTPALNLHRSYVNGNDWFNYSSAKKNTTLNLGTYDQFSKARITMDGVERFEKRDAIYFRQVQPYQHHSKIPEKEVYSYSFCLNPEEHQPSGTCNFSRIKTVILELEGCIASEILIFAINYNVLKIVGGMAAIKYN